MLDLTRKRESDLVFILVTFGLDTLFDAFGSSSLAELLLLLVRVDVLDGTTRGIQVAEGFTVELIDSLEIGYNVVTSGHIILVLVMTVMVVLVVMMRA